MRYINKETEPSLVLVLAIMSLKGFDSENEYWKNYNQRIVFRHRAALDFIDRGPVLDLGSGDGLFLEMLKNKGIEGVGLEASGAAVEKGRAKGLDVREVNFLDGKLPFDDNSFEAVILLDVLEHLHEPGKLLEETHRVARTGIVLSVPNFNSLPSRIQMLTGRPPENNKPKHGHVGHIYWFSYSTLKDVLKNSGFEIKEMRVNSFFSWAPILKNLMQFLAKIRPSIFALNFVIKAQKAR